MLEFFFRVGNVFTSNDDDAPFSNANDVHERTTFKGVCRVSGISMEALFSAALGGLFCLHVPKKNGGNLERNVALKIQRLRDGRRRRRRLLRSVLRGATLFSSARRLFKNTTLSRLSRRRRR